jgi:hypothetical protein
MDHAGGQRPDRDGVDADDRRVGQAIS